MAAPVFNSAATGYGNATLAMTHSVPCVSAADAGDLLVLAAVVTNTNQNADANMSSTMAADGWAEFAGNPYGTGGTNVRLCLFWKISEGDEGGTTISVVGSGGTSTDGFFARVFRFTCATGFEASPIEAVAHLTGLTASGSNAISCPTVTPGGVDRLAVLIAGVDDDAGNTASATGESGGNWTQAIAEFESSQGSGGTVEIQTANQSAGGAISGGTIAYGANGDRWVSVGFALIGVESPAGDVGVDVWQDFDFATLSEANLAAHDHASGGTWTIENDFAWLSTATAGEKQFTGTVNAGNDSGGTHGLKYQSPNDYEAGQVSYEFAANHSPVSFGFWFKFPTAFVGSFAGGEPDILYVENVLGEHELYIKLVDNNAAKLLLFTAEAGESAGVSVSPETWYWITAFYEQSGTHRMRVYDEDGEQVGSEQTRTSSSNQPTFSATLGSLIGDPSQIDEPFYFDDWLMDWTDATFPLGPPLASGETFEESFSLAGAAALTKAPSVVFDAGISFATSSDMGETNNASLEALSALAAAGAIANAPGVLIDVAAVLSAASALSAARVLSIDVSSTLEASAAVSPTRDVTFDLSLSLAGGASLTLARALTVTQALSLAVAVAQELDASVSFSTSVLLQGAAGLSIAANAIQAAAFTLATAANLEASGAVVTGEGSVFDEAFSIAAATGLALAPQVVFETAAALQVLASHGVSATAILSGAVSLASLAALLASEGSAPTQIVQFLLAVVRATSVRLEAAQRKELSLEISRFVAFDLRK